MVCVSESFEELMRASYFYKNDSSLEQPDNVLWELLKIFNVIADGVLVTDANDKIILINKNHPLLKILSPDMILGKNAFDLTTAGYWIKATNFDVNQLKTRLRPIDFKMRLQDGHESILTGIPVLDEGGNLRWLVFTSRDSSEIKAIEEKLKKEKDLRSYYEKRIRNNQPREMVHESASMQEILKLITRIGKTDSSVFLMGESGVGKDLIASKIHSMSPRNDQPFIHINCAAIPETLFESELFGYERGSFTGARKEGKTGLFEIAEGGTIYLDEITELSPAMQAKLLQVLQEREFRRLGGTASISFNARVISSTNQDIQEFINNGFRQDLYYRLCVIPVYIPPLRERKKDVRKLINVFMKEYNTKYGQHKTLDKDMLMELLNYDWPGNVRELQHVIERLVIMTTVDNIGLNNYFRINRIMNPLISDESLKDTVEKVEMNLLKQSMVNNKNTREAAKALGISQATFLRKLKKYDISIAR